MMEEYAIVTKSTGTTATLEVERRTACGLCGQKRGCGNATWGKMLGHNSHDFIAENQINAQVGDSVVVGIDEKAVLGSVFYLYVVPLISLLIGTLAADYLFKNQFYVFLSAALALVLGFLWVKGHLIAHGKSGVVFSKKYQAVVLRLADNEVGPSRLELDKAA